MGCISSKNVAKAAASPVYNHHHHRTKPNKPTTTTTATVAAENGSVVTLPPSSKAHSVTTLDYEKKGEDKSEDRSRDIKKSKGGKGSSFRLGFSQRYVEAEQVAAGWPSWLSSAAGEAVHGWVPLRADSFEKLEKIGQGTYSSVFRAREVESGKMVALKKVRFDNFQPESIRFMAREIMILRRLEHPNIMQLEGIITSKMSSSIYLVFEYMDHDLAGLVSSPNIKFSEAQIKCYMRQLLSAIEHCHLRGIMHRDIKASNILVNNEGVLKLADFGLANVINSRNKQALTSRVVTLWYRPPELLMGSTDYGLTVDLWSIGCVFAELHLGKPLLKGRTEYFKTKPYACDPSTLPKYPPNKEMDAKNREDARRKRANARAKETGVTQRPRRVRRNFQELNSHKVPIKEEAEENIQPSRRNGSNTANLSKEQGDIFQRDPQKQLFDTTSESQAATAPNQRGDSAFTAPIPVSASSGFAWVKKRKEEATSTVSDGLKSQISALDPSFANYTFEITKKQNGHTHIPVSSGTQDYELRKHHYHSFPSFPSLIPLLPIRKTANRRNTTMRSKQASALVFTLLAGLLSQSLLIPVLSTSIADQKSYYSPPDPHSGSPPSGSHSSPIPPSHGSGGTPHYSTPTPSTPSNPPSGGGGYNPPSSGGSPPSTPVDPGTPSTPSTPSVPSTPTTPTIPTTPFTCTYWLNHPGLIWGVLGWWGTLGNAFGATNVPGFGTNLNLLQALSNTRNDGYGALLREGTASYLNSLASNRFPYTTKQVRTSFVSALSSNKAAGNQANTFKLANEGKIKPRA